MERYERLGMHSSGDDREIDTRPERPAALLRSELAWASWLKTAASLLS